jgi:molybdate transport system permease protein
MPNLILSPIMLSLRVALTATCLVVLFGLPISWILARFQFPGRRLLSGILALPLVLPPTVLGLALLVLLSPTGPVGQPLDRLFGVRLVFHWTGAAVAAALASFPLFFLPARAAIAGVDPALEDAARLLGRSEVGVFANVTLPLAARGVLTGIALCFARALGDFGATLMVAGNIPGRTQTAALAIYDAAQVGDLKRALVLAALVALASITAVTVAQRDGEGRVS